MKKIAIPFVPELDNVSIELSTELLDEQGQKDTIEFLNWKKEYPYRPISIFFVARSSSAIYIKYNIHGLELIEMDESETCCGFGGTFAVKFSDISSAMAEKKVRLALETGAGYIISTEASCLMNINGYCAKHKLSVRGIHLVDVLAAE